MESARWLAVASASRGEGLVIGELRDHPAVKAWRHVRPNASFPLLVEPVRKQRPDATLGRPRLGLFRMHHGQDIGPTIAKSRQREYLETEYMMYRQVLPNLPIPQARCLGFTADHDPERAWLFLEDVGGDPYQNGRHSHRIAAARWLARVHALGMNTPTRSLLPDRGPSHYLSELRASCIEVDSHLSREHFSVDDRRILLATLRGLAELEERWDAIEAWCDAMPHTLVHGDFVAKNCRVRNGSTGGVELVAFDWEMAGWGVPATDLATNAFGIHGVALDRETYMTAMDEDWPGLGQLELAHAIRIGDAQRVIAAIRWSCDRLVYPQKVQGELRLYLPHLEQAIRLVSGNGTRRRRHGAAPPERVPKVVS